MVFISFYLDFHKLIAILANMVWLLLIQSLNLLGLPQHSLILF